MRVYVQRHKTRLSAFGSSACATPRTYGSRCVCGFVGVCQCACVHKHYLRLFVAQVWHFMPMVQTCMHLRLVSWICTCAWHYAYATNNPLVHVQMFKCSGHVRCRNYVETSMIAPCLSIRKTMQNYVDASLSTCMCLTRACPRA